MTVDHIQQSAASTAVARLHRGCRVTVTVSSGQPVVSGHYSPALVQRLGAMTFVLRQSQTCHVSRES